MYSTYNYNLPRNYPLIPSYPVQPNYPAEVVTYVNNYRCFANYFIVCSTALIFTEVYVKGTQYQTDSVSFVYVNREVI